ncbi:class I SAM-dependent methyltransferase [Amycolatopsis rhabdoformis]|uniref:Class I SAM-dependent methyltransferase n=1 Tax=Amycolatopsis rhabdoformis TaxID=1448059 RepID=A0ABZ1I3A0_9PSEU|nr:class I SAM-dependent methyltransferase [Amycolatopsis rhabdoformis]WSE28857.1 class I SAM-dependent methyltransferase [Amycolatopsis rhabdoformis]
MVEDVGRFWDEHAATFDEQPDHGLRDAGVRAAWRELLLSLMPAAPAVVVDLGCGTGSLAVLLAQAGYAVCGVDLSGRMIGVAEEKARVGGVSVDWRRGDVAEPPCEAESCDVVLVRHVLWAMADPAAAVGRWCGLLRPGGRLVFVEGRWATRAGLTAEQCQGLVLGHRREATVLKLDDPALWGAVIEDERYAVVSRF